MEALSKQLGLFLAQQKATISTAESCTGGWVSKCITDVPGSSQWFDRGFVTYSNLAKQEMLAVPEELFISHGAVSEPVVAAMSEGALQNSRATYSVAISGVAGPDGGSVEKPVGLVCFGWAKRDCGHFVAHQQFVGDREEIRYKAMCYAISELMVLKFSG